MNKPLKDNILRVYGREPETLGDLARCVISVIESQENGDVFERRRRDVKKMYKVLGFAWDIQYSDMVSNSHSSPEGYSQNWGRDETIPKGYPGWTGRVWFFVSIMGYKYRKDKWYDYPLLAPVLVIATIAGWVSTLFGWNK